MDELEQKESGMDDGGSHRRGYPTIDRMGAGVDRDRLRLGGFVLLALGLGALLGVVTGRAAEVFAIAVIGGIGLLALQWALVRTARWNGERER
jgi:hypothetical protein